MSVSPSNTMFIRLAVTGQGAVCVRLAGDLDLAAEPGLASLADALAAAQCPMVHIDLRPVTFASSSLINFVFRLAKLLPSHATISLCRPSTMTRQLIELTGAHEVATVLHDLPADWIAPWATAITSLDLQEAAVA